MSTELERALYYAKKKHGDQKYGSRPYHYHLEQVAKLVKEMGFCKEYQVVAILHDVIEDTEATWTDLSREFGSFVGNTVFCLSHREYDSYEEYLSKVSKHPAAKVIKTCDIICNLKESIISGDSRRIKKYEKALFQISFGS